MSLQDVLLAPTPDGFGVRRTSSSSSSLSSTVPRSFKSAKRRKTPQVAREERRRSRPAPEAEPVAHGPPELCFQALHEQEKKKVMSGVANLIFRHMTDEGHWGWPGHSMCGGESFTLREEDFSTVIFFEPQTRWRSLLARLRRCCCRRRRQLELQDHIEELLCACVSDGHFSEELVIIATVYLERLLSYTSVRLSLDNWQSILVAAIFLASKVWEDIHPWNIDFATMLRNAAGLRVRSRLSLYALESVFLKGLDWNVSLSGEVYAAYLFSLRQADTPQSPTNRHHHPHLLRRHSWCGVEYDSECLRMETILEVPEGAPPPARSSTRPLQPSYASEGNLTALQGHGLGSPQQQRPGQEDVPVMASLPWVDQQNPFIGCFRHAPHAEPPSRHINSRLPPPQRADRHSLLDPATMLAQGPVFSRAVSA